MPPAVSFRERIQDQSNVLIGDGGMGSMLRRHGFGDADHEMEWNVSHGGVVRSIQEEYVNAGSGLILTNSFGGNSLMLRRHGLEDRIYDLNLKAAQIARAASGGRAYVLGDIGPCGGVLEPYGDVTPEEARDGFGRQAAALLDGGVDGFIIETVIHSGEMLAAIKAVRDLTDLPIVASMTYNRTPEGYRTMFGESPDFCAGALADAGADVIAANCTISFSDMIGLVRELRAVTRLPIMVQPNAGLPELVDGVTVYRQRPDQMAKEAMDLIESGASLIGGCCGTDPEYIRSLNANLKR